MDSRKFLCRFLVGTICAFPLVAIVLVANDAQETVLLGWTLGFCSVLMVFGFFLCAFSLHGVDEEDFYDVGGGWIGLGAIFPVALSMGLWLVLCAIILVGRSVKRETVLTPEIGLHVLGFACSVAVGLTLDATRGRWGPLLQSAGEKLRLWRDD